MAVGNPHSIQGLKARDVPNERGTAAFCSRPQMVTVVIGVSLVMEKARWIEIMRFWVEIVRLMDGVSWHSHCVT